MIKAESCRIKANCKKKLDPKKNVDSSEGHSGWVEKG